MNTPRNDIPALAILLPVEQLEQLRPLLGYPSQSLPVIQA
jgi:hypothetical protein